MPFFNRLDAKKLPRAKQSEERSYKNGWRPCVYNSVYDRYTGNWEHDRKTGRGILLTRKMELYEGDFLNNYRHGSGTLATYLPKYKVFQLQYRGDWKYGRMHGHGLKAYPDGFYIGYFKGGKRNGYAQMWYNNGSFYDGGWVNDKRQGSGLLVNANGNRFEGSWLEDKKHGSGRLYFLNVGQVQIGVWKCDICVWSVIRNLPFRQAAAAPTLYPLPSNTLVNLDQKCAAGEQMAMNNQVSADLLVEYQNIESLHTSDRDERSILSKFSEVTR